RRPGLLEEVLQGERVHHRAEHAHVVGPAAVHPALAQFGAAEEVAAADDHRDLDAVLVVGPLRGGRGDLSGDLADDVGVDAQLPAAERLTRELQEDPTTTVLLPGHEHRLPSGRRPPMVERGRDGARRYGRLRTILSDTPRGRRGTPALP